MDIAGYFHLVPSVPFVAGTDGTRSLKTIITSRKAARDYRRGRSSCGELNTEEREILEEFERGELRRAAGADDETETARQAARSIFDKTRRVNLRETERDFNLARAREEGIPCETLLSSVIHKYLSGRLKERT